MNDEKKLDKDINVRSKLTDEEIVKALECCVKGESCVPCPYFIKNIDCVYKRRAEGNALDLIHRLQGENERLKDEKEEIRLFNLSLQNGEIDMQIESEIAKSFYNSIVQVFEQNGAKNFFTTTIDIEGKNGRYAFTIEKVGGQTVAEKLADQKAEIEQLTRESDEMFDRHAKENQAASILIEKRNNEIAELQKQVDELKSENTELHKEHTTLIAGSILEKQDIVKDTAKEILEMAKANLDEHWSSGVYTIYNAIRNSYGVEVE